MAFTAWMLAAALLTGLTHDDETAATRAAQSNVGVSLSTDEALAADPPTAGSDPPRVFHRSQTPRATGGLSASAETDRQGDPDAASLGRLPVRQSGPVLPWYRSGMVSLVVVLGLIYVAYRCVRRFVPGAVRTDHGVITVAARAALGPKQSLALIQIGRRRYVLVGLSGDRMTSLCEVTDEDEVAELAAGILTRRPALRRSFAADLSGADERLSRISRDVDAGSQPPKNGVEAQTPAVSATEAEPLTPTTGLERLLAHLERRSGKTPAVADSASPSTDAGLCGRPVARCAPDRERKPVAA